MDIICKNPKCKKKFRVIECPDKVPGGKDWEEIKCPYCHYENGPSLTSGYFKIEKIDE